ncbi:MAG: surface lipoprotein assembly modifier [Pseudomonadota bacterium]
MPVRLVSRLCATALLVALPCHAEVDDLVRDAQSALSQGRAQQAFDMLSAKEVERAGDPDFDLVLGMSANASAHYTRAIMALERVVAVQPDNAQARGELGRALFGVGDRKGARTLLQESKLEGTPIVAGETIDQLLQAVDRVEASGQSSYKWYVEATVGNDDNANAGPATRNLAVPAFGGAIVAIQPSGIATKARFFNTSAGLSGRLVLDPRWSLIGNAFGSARWHSGDADQFDYAQLDVNGGVSYRVEREEYTLVAQLGTYEIDHARVRNSTGVVGEWTYRFDGFSQASIYGQVGRLSYAQQPLSDADRSVIGVTYAQIARSGLFGYGGAYIGREDERAPGVPQLGHHLAGWRAGLQKPLGPALAIFGTVSYEKRNFGGADPLFLAQRRDRQTTASIGMSWVPAPTWRVTPQVAWTRTESTVPLADYDRHIFSVAVRREF